MLHRTGLTAESLWIEFSASNDYDQAASAWGVTAHQARRAVEFECALRSISPIHAPAD